MALKSMKYAADTWGVSVYTVRRLASAGIVHTVKVGRRRLIAASEIERIEFTGVPALTQERPIRAKGTGLSVARPSGKR